MSFTENYLKLRTEREGTSANDAGVNTPPASKQDSSSGDDGSTFAGRYMKLREQRQNMTISERADAKVRSFLDKQAQQNRTAGSFLQNAGAGPAVKTSGGYYSRPELGSASERLYGNITALEPVLTEKRAALDTAQTSLLQAETDLKTAQGHLQQAKAAYDADPTNENATYYNQIASAYNLAYDEYTAALQSYSSAYDTYKPYEDQLVDSLAMYQLYATRQQATFDNWRGTIRDTESIQMEIDAIDQQIKEQKKAEKAAADAAIPLEEKLPGYVTGNYANGGNTLAYAPGIQAQNQAGSAKNVSPEMQRLLDLKALLQEEYDWSMYYHYADMMQAPDFAEKSAYIPTERNANTSSGWENPLYEYINGNQEAGRYLSKLDDTAYFGTAGIGTPGIAATFGLGISGKQESQSMNQQEISIYNYLYHTQGEQAASDYYDYIQGDLYRRQRKGREALWGAIADEYPVLSSVKSWLTSPVKGISYVGQLIDYLDDGKIDENASYNKLVYENNAIRTQVAKKIEESGKWGKVGSFAYQTGMSMADFLLNTALTGNNQALTLTIMGSGAAADTVISAKDRGLSDGQAFWLGTIAGLAEAGMESINMETVFNPELLKDGIWKYIAKSAGAEGLEEVGTDAVNLVADILISKDQSEWQMSIDNYMKQGYSEAEAVARAVADQAMIMGADFFGGAMSGGILSGATAGVHVNYTNRMGSELGELDLDEEDIQAFIETGLESDPGTASYQLAVEMQAKIESGETLSNYDLARLYQANMQAIQEEETAKDLSGDSQTDAVAGEVTDPAGLSLPSVENDTQAPGFVTQNTQNGTQTQVNDTVLPTGVPLSIADQLRQEQAQNGGTQHERTYERAARPATAQPAGEIYAQGGNSLLPGSSQRNDGTSAGEQAGVLGGRAGQAAPGYQARVNAGRAAVQRTAIGKNLRTEKVSSTDLGVQNGTDRKYLQIIPEEFYDDSMAAKAEQVHQETGMNVVYILNRLEVRGPKGSIFYAKGAKTENQIIVQANNTQYTAEQIADHEAYHGMADPKNYGQLLNDNIVERIAETFSREEFDEVLNKYIAALSGVYDLKSAKDGYEYEQRVNDIIEELLADAHAGMNMWDAGATRFTDTVDQFLDENYITRKSGQDNGTEQPTGPPVERFSADNTQEKEMDGLTLPSLDDAESSSDSRMDEMDTTSDPSPTREYVKEDVSQETVETGIRKVAHMDPVAQISGGEFAKGEKDLITQVTEFFTELDNRAYNPQLGSIALDRQGVRSDIAHGIGRKKAAAFAAVPDVLARGYVVDYQKNWKGRGYDTAVVAAPVQIGSEEYLMGIVLNRNPPENKFYVHEVMTTENGASPFKTGTRKGDPSGNTPSVFSILDKIRSVKNEATTQERFSLDDAGGQVAIGDLQAELYQLQHQRRSLLEADTAYAAAADNLRYANTFTEKVAARKAMAAAAANIDTAAIDQQISDLNEQISEIRNRETRRHREDQEKYSGTKTAGYSTMLDTRLKDLDQDYMKAVRSGDRARMAELVEQAAEAAMPASVVRDKSGRLLKTYHHTGNRFTVFDRNMARTGTEMDGFFFAPDPDSTSEYGSNMITAYLNITKLAMDPKLDRKFNDSGTLLREKLAYQGYDGVARTENGEIYEYMTFDPEQIKSADPVVYDDRGRVVPLSERFNFHNPDIRYSVDDEGSQQVQEQKPAAPKKKIRPVAESRPLIAKKDLRSTVLNLFSIPNGQRAEVGAMVDSYADRLIKNGSLTEDDRKAFFDRMYDAGVMVMPAEEYSAFARSHIVDGRIYVSDSVKSDFGDDWADIRRRAFAAGVYLVNDRSASGIDQWNATLSAEDMLPGLFDSEETDERTILERILQVAEEGKDEHLSLAEYTRRLSQQEGISEDEFLDNMERQLDWALRTFAENARLEVHLRDRTGRKIAQEREKGAERMTRQQAKEAQRRADERQARKDSARRAKERRELRELQQRTLKQLQWLSRNRNRAPEELQATWDEVLGDIDLYAISAADEMRWSDKHNATWKDLAQMYKDAMKNDPNFLPSKELERIVTRLDATKIADMDLGALQDLYKAAIGLRTEFYNRNNVINDEMQRLFAEVYTDAKREIENAPGENSAKKGKVSGWADKFLNLDQLTPMNVLQRMGGWDPDGAFYSMAKQLERGERDMRAYSVKAQKMLQDFLTEHEDWVKKADGQGKDGLWYKIEIPELVALELGKTPQFGGTIEVWMTPMQKIHMYLESKNQDNLRHMTGGRTFADKQIYSEGKRQEAFAQGKTVRMAPETVKAIVKDLTAEEMELAQILDRYYNTFATQEINKVSNTLYGYDKAMGKNYAPIYTNRNYTKTEFGVFDTTAEGVGNLKGRQYAVNPSYNISAFDAFERHVDQTARFCGMAIPARNWTTLMNWREKNNSTGDVITHKWGEQGKKYIEDLITTLQAGDDTKSESVSTLASRLQSNYISAVFGANPSIVLKQLGSIPLAGAYLDARNMPTPAQISKIDRSLISKYTQELEWRTMGYATPETKQVKDNPNWTQTNKAFKFVFGGGAITAMDGWAASTLWPWAENKVRREHPELTMGTKAQIDAGESPFYKKVAEEFEIAVSRSQSVSDEIHQGTLRKSKNPITKAFTMFRSDSAQTYNALRQKIGEARYYMRTGAKEKVVQTAKKAVGTVFVAMLLNAAWSEAVSFLMALWKNKGKYYRDDEDELTFRSVSGEMVSNMFGSFAGIVTGGEELFEVIGNIITGDTWYGIETPGMEQLNDLLDTLIESGSGMRDLVAGGWDVVKNGGDLGAYFKKHIGQILGSAKDLASSAATYVPGLPANNLEAYLVGALKWISPDLGAAYDDLFSDTRKNDLAGMEGDALEGRIGRILSDRNISESDDTAVALAALYEAGYKTAIPSDTPTSVSIDGEKRSLGAYQQQAYDTIWGGIVADALDDMVASDSFKEADPKTQAKMLSNLYTYAAEQAKAELFDEYELDSGATKNAAIVAADATVAECITWNTITSEMKSGEKSAELAAWDIPEEVKREIFRCKISDSREDSITAFDEVGLSFDQFLQAYSMYGQINNEDLKAGMKAVEFSHWVNAQGYTAEQAAVVKDELTYFNMTPASSSRYDELVEAGMDPDEAYELTGALNELQPEEGEVEVSDLQKWRASVDFSDDVEDQLAALSAVMTDAQFLKVEIANNFGVSPDAYVTLQEIKSQYDADGNGSYKNDEIKAAIDGLPGYYTTEQKAVLWQLATGSTSARNNPYSRQVGQQILDAKEAAKSAAPEEGELEGLKLGSW